MFCVSIADDSFVRFIKPYGNAEKDGVLLRTQRYGISQADSLKRNVPIRSAAMLRKETGANLQIEISAAFNADKNYKNTQEGGSTSTPDRKDLLWYLCPI